VLIIWGIRRRDNGEKHCATNGIVKGFDFGTTFSSPISHDDDSLHVFQRSFSDLYYYDLEHTLSVASLSF